MCGVGMSSKTLKENIICCTLCLLNMQLVSILHEDYILRLECRVKTMYR